MTIHCAGAARVMIKQSLIREILEGYPLPRLGVHGVGHWGRVLENGLRLSEETGAKKEVVALFSVFHDARRENEDTDPGHGRRGADLARRLRAEHMALSDEDFDLLVTACVHHTDGRTKGDVTVQTCWDADRLDLWRVLIVPDEAYLCTSAAKDESMQEWARPRSLSEHVPSFVREEWLVGLDELEA